MLQVEQITSEVRYCDFPNEREPKMFIGFWHVQMEGRDDTLTVISVSEGIYNDYTTFFLFVGALFPPDVTITSTGVPFNSDHAESRIYHRLAATPRTVCDFIADCFGLVPTYTYARATTGQVTR